jgi:hypothetical protein
MFAAQELIKFGVNEGRANLLVGARLTSHRTDRQLGSPRIRLTPVLLHLNPRPLNNSFKLHVSKGIWQAAGELKIEKRTV